MVGKVYFVFAKLYDVQENVVIWRKQLWPELGISKHLWGPSSAWASTAADACRFREVWLSVFCYRGLCCNLYRFGSWALGWGAGGNSSGPDVSLFFCSSLTCLHSVCTYRPCLGLGDTKALPECQSPPYCPWGDLQEHSHAVTWSSYR